VFVREVEYQWALFVRACDYKYADNQRARSVFL